MKTSVQTHIHPALLWAAALLGTSLVTAYGFRQGYIDAELKGRMIALNGVWVIWLGNRLPKAFVPSTCAQRARRVVAWSMVLSGLVYVGAFVFAPLREALTIATSAGLIGMAVSIAYCLSLRSSLTSQ